jgi:hypothetical protein
MRISFVSSVKKLPVRGARAKHPRIRKGIRPERTLMGDLFFNKLAGAIIGIGLIIMGLMELSNRLFEVHPPETLAVAVDLDVAAPVAEEEEPEGPVDFGVLLANADVSSGARVARRCASCHSFEEGGANATGPLHVGRDGPRSRCRGRLWLFQRHGHLCRGRPRVGASRTCMIIWRTRAAMWKARR